MPEGSNDFINVARLAKALAEELKPVLEANTPLKRVFNMEEAAICRGMPLSSFKAKVVRDGFERCARTVAAQPLTRKTSLLLDGSCRNTLTNSACRNPKGQLRSNRTSAYRRLESFV